MYKIQAYKPNNKANKHKLLLLNNFNSFDFRKNNY